MSNNNNNNNNNNNKQQQTSQFSLKQLCFLTFFGKPGKGKGKGKGQPSLLHLPDPLFKRLLHPPTQPTGP